MYRVCVGMDYSASYWVRGRYEDYHFNEGSKCIGFLPCLG